MKAVLTLCPMVLIVLAGCAQEPEEDLASRVVHPSNSKRMKMETHYFDPSKMGSPGHLKVGPPTTR